MDQEGAWGCRSIPVRVWWNEILPKLQHFESMTWAEIMQAAGGRARGNNSHFVQVGKLTRQAKARLAEIGPRIIHTLHGASEDNAATG